MLKRYFLALYILIGSSVSAQLGTDYGFNCQFNANEPFTRFKWDDGTFKTKQVNGNLELSYTKDGSIFISDWADINWQKPFSIKTFLN
ncbi:MAG: hypothetical protein IPJ60_00940 [Sphingobacteriaceae bacterium]|nr:hypothetical protein [Sphingobacteriaceae bacterium]